MTDRRKITNSQRRELAEYVQTYCPLCEWEPCGQPITPDDDWVIDHRVPCIAITALGLHGEHWPYLLGDIINLQPMHKRCNADKGDVIVSADVRGLRDAWNDALREKDALYVRVLSAINADARHARQQANLDRQLPLFG